MDKPIEDILAEIARFAFSEGGKVRLTCAHAHLIAKKTGIKLGDLGRICNEQHIKICQCQLGCF